MKAMESSTASLMVTREEKCQEKPLVGVPTAAPSQRPLGSRAPASSPPEWLVGVTRVAAPGSPMRSTGGGVCSGMGGAGTEGTEVTRRSKTEG